MVPHSRSLPVAPSDQHRSRNPLPRLDHHRRPVEEVCFQTWVKTNRQNRHPKPRPPAERPSHCSVRHQLSIRRRHSSKRRRLVLTLHQSRYSLHSAPQLPPSHLQHLLQHLLQQPAPRSSLLFLLLAVPRPLLLHPPMLQLHLGLDCLVVLSLRRHLLRAPQPRQHQRPSLRHLLVDCLVNLPILRQRHSHQPPQQPLRPGWRQRPPPLLVQPPRLRPRLRGRPQALPPEAMRSVHRRLDQPQRRSPA